MSHANTADTQHMVDEADALFARGDFSGALASYRAAYKAKANPELLVQIGLCFEALGQDALAVRAFERYLDVAPKGRQRIVATERVAALKGVGVTSTPTKDAHASTAEEDPKVGGASAGDNTTEDIRVGGKSNEKSIAGLSTIDRDIERNTERNTERSTDRNTERNTDRNTEPGAQLNAHDGTEDSSTTQGTFSSPRSTSPNASDGTALWIAVGAASTVILAGSAAAVWVLMSQSPAPNGKLGTFDLR